MIRGPAEPIAIIGIGCRFPGARGADEFWRMIREGRHAIREVPQHRVELGFNIDEIYDPRPGTPGKISSKMGGFLDHPELFDPFIFGLSPRDAVAMEPHQRFALEVVGDALDDAGIPHDALMGERVAVIFGRMAEDYSREQIAVLGEDRFRRNMDVWGAAGIAGSVLAGRISFWLGTRGPSFMIDTACSTSLLAVHLGCQSIWSGETQMAIAGGVNVFLSPEGMIALSRVGMLASDGLIKAFDDRANGFVRAEGAGAVILRPLADALANNDPIHAVIRGTGFSADGRDGGHMMAPGRYGQAQAMRDAYARAGIAPSEVQFVETHGTGTVIGDPVEVRALADVMGPGRAADRPLRISSVKGNIGHCEPASGVAGLIKATYAVKHRELPPQMHFETPSKAIAWDEVPIRVQAELAPWPVPERALAGVNSFGISGTNAHVVIEEAPALPALPDEAERPRLVAISAHTDRALVELADALRAEAADAASAPPLRDLAYTFARRRSLRGQRLALVVRNNEELAGELAGFLSGAPSPSTTSGVASGKPAGVVFAFSGHGTHWAGMGRELLATEPVFAAAIDAWDRETRALGCGSLRDLLERAVGGAELDRIDVLQPALTGIAIALARQWEQWGVRPSAVIGHSSGEIAAAHVAGCISLGDAARIACARGAVVRELAPPGAMALVALPPALIAEDLSRVAGRAAIAGSNSPTLTVLSGEIDAIESLVAGFGERGVFARKLRVEFASHGPHMDALAPELARRVAGVEPRAGELPFHSTVTTQRLDGSALGAAYWGDNLRAPVRFSETAAALVAVGSELFLEIGPNPVLKLALEEIGRAAGKRVSVVPSLRRDADDRVEMLAALGALFVAGASLDFAATHPVGRVARTPLYPYQREEYWFGGKRGIDGKRAAHPFAGMLGVNALELEPAQARGDRIWQLDLFRDALGGEVRLDGSAVIPTAELVATALSAGARLWPQQPVALESFSLEQPLTLPRDGARTLQLAAACDASGAALGFASRLAGSAGAFERNASVRIARVSERARAAREPLAEARARCGVSEARDAFYAALDAAGLSVPKERRVVREAAFGDREGLARVAYDAPLASNESIPAPLVDASLQLLARCAERDEPAALWRFEPVGIASVALGSAPAKGELWLHARLAASALAVDDCAGDVSLLNAAGDPVLSLRGVRLARRARPAKTGAGPWLYEIAWRALAEGAAPEPWREQRGGVWHAPRLVAARAAAPDKRAPARERAFSARAAEPTRLAGALLHEIACLAPGAGEVAVEVRAAGLSFLDVLRTLGVESEGAPRELGCELAGVVTAVGAGVNELAVGDAVLGFARGALATRVVTPAPLLVRKPAALGFAAAAALPLAKSVAHYALHGIARLRAGEHVLVHSAGGALGHEAVALAHSLGARVIATAGSARKRASLLAAGAARVADSRAPALADEVLRETGGRGVDVALDFAGDGAPLAALAAGGRYVAIDRTGSPSAAPPRGLRRNLSLHSIDPLGLLESKPEELAGALRAALAASPPGEGAAAVTVFPISQLGRALRFMAQARQIGKVVVSFAGAGAAKIAPLPIGERIAEGAALVAGPIERFPALDAWLRAQQPREIVRVSRCEDAPQAAARLAAPLRAIVCALDEGAPATSLALASALDALAAKQGVDLLWLAADAQAFLGAAGPAAAALVAEISALARAARAAGRAVTAIGLGLAPEAGPSAQPLLSRIAASELAECVLHTRGPGEWDGALSPLLAELVATSAPRASALASASPEERLAKVRELVASALAVVLRLGAEGRARIDWHRPLAELGLDSLMGVELHTRMEEAAGVEIPAALLFAEPDLEAVATRIANALAAH